MSANIDLDGRLAARGLLDAARAAGWKLHTRHYVSGWAYPVYNVRGDAYQVNGQPALRWKNAGGESPKYLWVPARPDGVRYYLLPDTVAAIRAANGTVYLAAGEPDVLAYRAAGFVNTLCWFDGEASIPATFAADMKLLGVRRVTYAPDRDREGMRAACKVQAALDGTGIELDLCALPGHVGTKHDINWLWTACAHEVEAFRQRFATLPALDDTDLALYGAADDAPAGVSETAASRAGDLYREWIGYIVESLGQPDRRDGRHPRWHCPLVEHQDDDPSFRVSSDQNPNFPWPVCSCGIQDRDDAWGVVAAALGVDSWREFKARKRAVEEWVPEHLPPPRVDEAPPADEQAAPPPAVEEPVFVDSLLATTNLIAELNGDLLPDVEPIRFPFNRLHQFDGMAYILMPRKLVYVLGVSGGGKTSFAEQCEAQLRQEGHDSIWWGPEWSPEEMAMRALQRAGGLTMRRVMQNRLWMIDDARGVELGKRHGLPAPGAALKNSRAVLRSMLTWPGRAHYISRSDLPPRVLFDEIRNQVHGLRALGRKVSTLWIDYLQLWNNYGRPDDAMSQERAAGGVKALCEELGLVGFVLLQPRKGDSEHARDGEVLHHAAAQGLSDQKANLYIALTPIFDEDGNKLDEAEMAVIKNSMGETGKLRCPVQWPRMLWVDCEPMKLEEI